MRTGEIPWQRLLAELAVIVAGVLIALAMDAWWERRQEANQARQYLEQLLVDFQTTERRLRGAIEADSKRVESVNSVIDRALRGQLPEPDSLELPTGYNYFEPLTGTLTALVQGGDLRLLPGDSIRFALIALAALMHETEAILRHTETLIWNSTEDVVLGRARHSHSERGWGQVDVAGTLNDPEIISALQMQVVASQVRLFNLRRLQGPTSQIVRLIRAELN